MFSQIRLVELFRKECEEYKEIVRLFLISFGSSLSNILILVILNKAVIDSDVTGLNLRFFVMYICAVAAYFISARYMYEKSYKMTEKMVHRLRLRFGDKIRKGNFYELEKLGHSEIYTAITRDTGVISSAGPTFIAAAQSAIVVVFFAIYIIFISVPAFLIVVISSIISVWYYLHNDKIARERFKKVYDKQVVLFRSITSLLDGFQEIKLNELRNEDVYADFDAKSNEAKDLTIWGMVPYSNNYIFSIAFFYCLLGAVVFMLPNFTDADSAMVAKLMTSILFIIGPLGTVVGAISQYGRTNLSVDNLYKLEAALEKNRDFFDEGERKNIRNASDFKAIHLESLYFRYDSVNDTPGFSIGPFDLSIERNETVFIVGGNGSGKTTLLKVLLGLYYPSRGFIRLDNTDIQPQNIQSYRDQFAAVLSEFYLFEKLYGFKEIDEKRLADLLNLMQISHKTAYVNEKFTNLNLSTGQRKRLALVIAYLENRNIYVFDEWAADQDPNFRRYFYQELIPDLKKQGKTIIAVTHDDRFYDSADRVLKMDFGKIATLQDNKSRV